MGGNGNHTVIHGVERVITPKKKKRMLGVFLVLGKYDFSKTKRNKG
jgi:hypothetical protein